MNMEMNDLCRTREHELRDTDHWKLEMFWVFSASEGLLEGRLWRTGTSVLLTAQSQPSVRDCFKESLLTMTNEADGISWCAKRPNWRRRWKTKTRPRPWTSVRFTSDRFSALNLQRSKSQKESVIIYLFFADPTIYRRVFRYVAL